VNKRRRFKVKRRRALRKAGVGPATCPWWAPPPMPPEERTRFLTARWGNLLKMLSEWPPEQMAGLHETHMR
jgi:hypothetical protein